MYRDLKMISILLGKQAGYTKYPCLGQEWPIRHELKPGNHNVKVIPFVNSNNILLPSLHIKLELMKTVVKALNKECNAFIHLKKYISPCK